MPIKKYLNRVEQFDYLVRAECTGPPAKIAPKLGLAESTFYAFLNGLKYDYNFPISYCRKRMTYFYYAQGQIVNLHFKKLTQN